EVTYGLHIIIRFEIERDLFTGKVDLSDLPQVWNEKYQDYLGIEVKNDTEGVMQDLHWYNVYWGYFQGYHLGDVMNSQIHETMIQEIPNWKENLQTGDFTAIKEYNIKNIYSKGALYDPLDLIQNVTGEALSTKYLKNYLEDKYSKLYQF
ncbi:MAG: carboxypeptidase M32, partial [Candidatus Kariarchaeaceae archaeon]